ncbi:alpha/beta hydrolase [Streptomyces sp. TRM68367]|uniref:alpha/beta fold hydrolase n=1 Tax=Streptomyces sp. TRM68367 TaxID=2758415 RepID=UPI0029346575|nr:alpha/beta hydrolase [Streptomyces sp. TRM68367]
MIAVGHSMGGQVVNLLAGRHQHAVHSVVALDPAHGADESEAEVVPARLAAYRTHGARAAAAFVADSFAPTSPPGLATAHVRTMLGTPDHVVVQAYAGMYTDADAVGVRKQSEEYLRHRICPSLTVWTAGEPATWENENLHVRGSRVDHWPDTGHYMHEERPRRTIKLIEKWADSTLED